MKSRCRMRSHTAAVPHVSPPILRSPNLCWILSPKETSAQAPDIRTAKRRGRFSRLWRKSVCYGGVPVGWRCLGRPLSGRWRHYAPEGAAVCGVGRDWQEQGRAQPWGILLQATIAHLGQSKDAFQDVEDVLDLGSHLRLRRVFSAFFCVRRILNLVRLQLLSCACGAAL